MDSKVFLKNSEAETIRELESESGDQKKEKYLLRIMSFKNLNPMNGKC